ncbi:MAG TPA: glycoside hydrolase family 97 C-terminal domain-containing protein [Fibrella sp.]
MADRNYISLARRKGSTWFIGSAMDSADWKGALSLDFPEK